MTFDNCTADPRTGNILTSPEFTLPSDQELTFTMASVTYNNYSTVSVYKTSILGRIGTLLGSYTSVWNISAVTNVTHSVCLPAGTYQLVFIASEVEHANHSTVFLTEVLLADSSCTYTSPAGNQYKAFTAELAMGWVHLRIGLGWLEILYILMDRVTSEISKVQ